MGKLTTLEIKIMSLVPPTNLANEIKIDYNNNKSFISPKGLSILFDYHIQSFTRSVNTGGKKELFEFMYKKYHIPKDTILKYFNINYDGYIPDTFVGLFARYLDKYETNPQAEMFLDVAAAKTVTQLFYAYKGIGTKFLNAAEMMKSQILLKPVENDSPYRYAWKRAYKALYGRDWRESPNGDMRVAGHWIWNYLCSDPHFAEILRNDSNPVTLKVSYNGKKNDSIPYRDFPHYKFLTPELKSHLDKHVEEVTELMFQASEFSNSILKNRRFFAKLMHKMIKTDEKIDKIIGQNRLNSGR